VRIVLDTGVAVEAFDSGLGASRRFFSANLDGKFQTVVNGQADRLVTFNLKHLSEAVQRFGLYVGQPGETWRELQKGSHAKK